MAERIAINPERSVATACSACGEPADEHSGRFCLICGKLLSEGYEPLDAIRSGYGLQRRGLEAPGELLFDENDLFRRRDGTVASQIAWASLVYSLVPYLGILFVPLTLFSGAFGALTPVRHGAKEDKGLPLLAALLSLGVLALQIFLWWLLYVIPEIYNPWGGGVS